MTEPAGLFELPFFFFPYAVIQTALFLLLIRAMDHYEKEPLWLVGILALWGSTIAVGISLVGNVFFDEVARDFVSTRTMTVYGAAMSAPFVEELAKGVALLAAFGVSFWVSNWAGIVEFDGPTDGLVYGAAIGLGFAFTEDVLYFFNYVGEGLREGANGLSWGIETFLFRRDFVGLTSLTHAVYTAAFGAGLGLATWSKSRLGRIGWPVLGLITAMLLHSLHNGMIGYFLAREYGLRRAALFLSERSRALRRSVVESMRATYKQAITSTETIDLLIVILFLLAMAYWLWRQHEIVKSELTEEVRIGTLPANHFSVVTTLWGQSEVSWNLFVARRWETLRQWRRINSELIELAFLKHRLRARGGNWQEVDARRRRVRSLQSQEVIEARSIASPE